MCLLYYCQSFVFLKKKLCTLARGVYTLKQEKLNNVIDEIVWWCFKRKIKRENMVLNECRKIKDLYW